MSSAKITLIGFYKMFDSLSDDLFKNLSMPEEIDKQTLVDNILLKGGEFETLYSDAEFVQSAIGVWSRKWAKTFEKWVTALNIEYNPLENYDRFEKWIDTENTSSTGHSTDTSSGSGNVDNKISAFNSSTMQNDTNSISSNNTQGTTDLSNTGNRTAEHSARAHGNIGVTTSQQMLQSELDIAMWNVYEHITDLFLSEFIIPIY